MVPQDRLPRSRGGFTLPEVLLAFLLLALGVLAESGAMVLGGRLVDHGRDAARVAAVATARLETLRREYRVAGICPLGVSGPSPGILTGTSGRPPAAVERWSGVVLPGSILVEERVTAIRGRRRTTDTTVTAVPC